MASGSVYPTEPDKKIYTQYHYMFHVYKMKEEKEKNDNIFARKITICPMITCGNTFIVEKWITSVFFLAGLCFDFTAR